VAADGDDVADGLPDADVLFSGRLPLEAHPPVNTIIVATIAADSPSDSVWSHLLTS
jgi:hypothetical protein